MIYSGVKSVNAWVGPAGDSNVELSGMLGVPSVGGMCDEQNLLPGLIH